MMKILLLTANASDTARLRAAEEGRAIDASLRNLKFSNAIQLETGVATRISELPALLLRQQPDIVHFSGHGTQQGELLLQDEVGNAQPVSTEALSQVFALFSDVVRCVVLNANYSEAQAQAIAEHISCVVGMAGAISDEAALAFATAFYSALGSGRDVQTAFDLGQVQLVLTNPGEQTIPHLITISGTSSAISFVERSERDTTEQHSGVTKVLLLAANPSDTERLRLDEEFRAIQAALRASEFYAYFQMEVQFAVRPSELTALLLRHQPDIVHFSGHGATLGELIFEDDAGRSQPVSAEVLSQVFALFSDVVRCVVLNANYSEPQARAIAQHISCVVGMAGAISDEAALAFATAFYVGLGSGRDVQFAFELACLQITIENLSESNIPCLVAISGTPSAISFVERSERDTAEQSSGMIKILLLAANPSDTARLRLDEEFRSIQEVLRTSEFYAHFQTEVHFAVRPNELTVLLLRQQPDIVHFSGHGTPQGELIFESESGSSQPISAKALSQVFALFSDVVRCVVLNVAYSEVPAQAVAEHISCVVGMAGAISDEAALVFTIAFYRGLGYGHDVQMAFDLGQAQLELAYLNWQTVPRLFAIRSTPAAMTFVAQSERTTTAQMRSSVPKILLLTTSPSETERLRLDEESRAIDAVLRKFEFHDAIQLETGVTTHLNELTVLLLRQQPDIVHFSGHGTPQGELIFESESGSSQPISAKALSQVFALFSDVVRCVVLNVAYSEVPAQAVAEHISCVVGMAGAISDAASIAFATVFYSALGSGRDVPTAFELGRVQLAVANLDGQDVLRLLTISGTPSATSFVERSERNTAEQRSSLTKILLLAANPSDMQWIRVDKEFKGIQEALRISEFHAQFQTEVHFAVRPSELTALLLRQQPDIVHFSGFGSPEGNIFLQDEGGLSQLVSVQALSQVFALFKDVIRCVVLNTSYSEAQAQVIAEHIPYVVGADDLSDEVAINFATAFYQALGYGHDVQTAFEFGQVQIAVASLGAQGIPRLFSVRSNAAAITFIAQQERTLAQQHDGVSKILLLAANPLDRVRLRLDEEFRAIQDTLRTSEFNAQFQVEVESAVQPRELMGLLLHHQPDIVHFSGHGTAQGELLLQDERGNAQPISVQALSQVFALFKDVIRCVVLNATYSEAQAQAIAEHIPCVVGMTGNISDTAATAFATAFYSALATGRDVQTAFDLGWVQLAIVNPGEQDILCLFSVRSPSTDIAFVKNREMSSLTSNELFAQKLAAVQSIADEKTRAEVLTKLAPYVTGSLLEQALSVARSIKDSNARVRVLVSLIPQLLSNERERVLQETLSLLHSFEDIANCVDALFNLVPHLSQEEQQQLLQDEKLAESLKIAQQKAKSESTVNRESAPVRWYTLELAVESDRDAQSLTVWQKLTLVIRARPVGEDAPPSTTTNRQLAVPMHALELAVYVDAPGFAIGEGGQQPYSIPLTLASESPQSTSALHIALRPLVAGQNREIRIQVYPSKAVDGMKAILLSATLDIQRPRSLPNQRELVDRRAIPAPWPDVQLNVVLLTGEDGSDALDLYLTASRLERKNPEWIGQIRYDQVEIATLRQVIYQAITSLPVNTPVTTQNMLRTLGITLYDRLVPPALHVRIQELLSSSNPSNAPWTWLIVSDEKAMLPWELLLLPDNSFMAERFVVSHWVGGQNLTPASEVPLARRSEQRAMTYYDDATRPERRSALPRWVEILGIAPHAGGRGHEYILHSDTPYFGLHFLRYYDDYTVRAIAMRSAANALSAPPKDVSEAVNQIQHQQLDFTLRRPLITLSLLDEQSGRRAMGLSSGDVEIESFWLVPLVRAGAAALVGPRWPTAPAADQLFYLYFYAYLEDGASLSIGQAVWEARKHVRAIFPERTDWLAYTCFGHPACTPYQVEQSEGFTFCEALDPPLDDVFVAGITYHFRATYRRVAPVWYQGRLRLVQALLPGEEISVRFMPAVGPIEPLHTLRRVGDGDDYEAVFALTMPREIDTLSVVVQFIHGERNLRTLLLNLKLTRD